MPAAGPFHRQAGARPVRADPRPRGRGAERPLLRDRRNLRPQGGEVRDLDGGRPRPVPAGRRVRRVHRRVRQRDMPLADHHCDPRPLRASDRLPVPRLRPGPCPADRARAPGSRMVGIVVVSHSEALAAGVVCLARRDGRARSCARSPPAAWMSRACWAPTPSACGPPWSARCRRRRARDDGPRERADERRTRARDARRAAPAR